MGKYTHTMKCLILVCVVFTVAAKASQEEDTKLEGGLYFDQNEVNMACTAGTPLGVKIAQASAACMEASTEEEFEVVTEIVANRRRKCRGRRCKGKGKKKCPSVGDVKEKMETEMEGDLCILSQLGWIDAEGQAIEDVMTADLMTLPSFLKTKLRSVLIRWSPKWQRNTKDVPRCTLLMIWTNSGSLD